MADSADAAGDGLLFYLNGTRTVIAAADVQSDMTLIEYLRSNAVGLTGTKLGCAEGGCGACTVTVSHFDRAATAVVHRSINSCLAPLVSVDGAHVVTVEGLGSLKRGDVHPVQRRLGEFHASQCGYCTPGIVMALYTYLTNHPAATQADIEEAMDGNLCRCTGYRPILDAAKSFAVDAERGRAVGAGCCGGGGGGGGGCCKGGAAAASKSERAAGDESKEPEAADNADAQPDTLPGVATQTSCTHSKQAAHATMADAVADAVSGADGGDSKQQQIMRNRQLEVAFPDELRSWTPKPLRVTPHALSAHAVTWHRPVTLPALLALKHAHPDARLIVGNTEVGIENRFKHVTYPVLVAATHVPELNAMRVVDDDADAALEFGASVTLTTLQTWLRTLQREWTAPSATPAMRARAATTDSMLSQLRWFSSAQIRNACCIGGNLCTASPISDMAPVLQSLDAVCVLQSVGGGDNDSADAGAVMERSVPLSEWFLGYRKTALRPTEVLVTVRVPLARAFTYQQSYKQARRREDDIAIVTAGCSMSLELVADSSPPHFKITAAALSFGGMAPTTVMTPQCQVALVGQPLNAATLAAATTALAADLPMADHTPGGQEAYRRTLALSFLYKFYQHVCVSLRREGAATHGLDAAVVDAAVPVVADDVVSCATAPHRNTSSGRQVYQVPTDRSLHVGADRKHVSALQQLTGEAEYTTDMPDWHHTQHAAFVLSTHAHARIKSVYTAAALAVHESVRYFCHSDVPGDNMIGDIVQDEELFASEEVVFVGQPIGLCVAATHNLARKAAQLVRVEYEALDSIISIDDAIAAGSFFPPVHAINTHDQATLDAAMSASPHTLDGDVSMGGQEHFYLEVHNCMVWPRERDTYEVYASTQNLRVTQELCAHVLGIRAHTVAVRVKRMGGGFGGKETRSTVLTCAAAVAAHHTQQPVRITLDRDADMAVTGQRHAFKGVYKVGFDEDGRVTALDVKLYNNGGYSHDLSVPVLDRSLFHVDGVYDWPILRAEGRVCKTNQQSHTAFRGFGGPQGMFVTETIIDRVARTLNLAPELVRERNMYREGALTHFKQPLADCHIRRCYQECRAMSQFDRVREEVDAFNAKHRHRKRGVCLMATKFGISFTAQFMNQGGALVLVYTDGSVLVTHGGTEMGQGLHTKMIQIVAQRFGIAMDEVHVQETASDKVANTSPTAASFSSDINGYAVLDACEQIMARLEPVRVELLAAKAKEAAQRTGDDVVTGQTTISFKELVRAAFFQRINLCAQGFHKVPGVGYDFDKGEGTPFRYFTYGAACSVVEIDTLTGDSHVLSTDISMDLGTSLNPAIDVGQVEGGYTQGLGLFTMEEVIYGDDQHRWLKRGQLLTRGPGAYKIPGFNDVPVRLNVNLVKNAPNKLAVHSSKAVGEPPVFLAASVFFALKDAVAAARTSNGSVKHPGVGGAGDVDEAAALCDFKVDSPFTSERVRMACCDDITRSVGADATYQCKGSF